MGRTLLRRLAAAAAAVVLLVTLPGLAAAQPPFQPPGPPPGTPPDPRGALADADDFTGTAGPLADGQLELAVLSTRAATVTGGDALIGVRGVSEQDQVTITANGADVTAAFAPEPDEFNPGRTMLVGLVADLHDGDNDVAVAATHPVHGARRATLPVTNHPITGPVFSGPHQTPFVCRTDDIADLPADQAPDPADPGCEIEPYVAWYYLSTNPVLVPGPDTDTDEVPGDLYDWVKLDDPFGPYPPDVATTRTTEGTIVPAIARVETRTINRGITRIAILDDPAARGPEAPFETPEAWNERLLYNWGASCGIGRQQGVNTPNEVLSGGVDAGGSALDVGPEVFRPAVLQGYLVAHSSMTIFNTHCNQVLSAETMMMVREFLIERYGRFDWVMGNGASGGAIQQYTTMNGYPGLQDGGVPLISFPDVVTTAMSPADCRLLRQTFSLQDSRPPVVAQVEEGADRELPIYGPNWTLEQRNAVTGHDFQGICEDWDVSFADLLKADVGCSQIPVALRYDHRDNPDGERCTLQDNLVHYLGVDPDTGFARRPLDNVGVQYGYQALVDGTISTEQFLWLNRHIGSFDVDGYGPWDPEREATGRPVFDVTADAVQPRMAMDPDLARDLYRHGFVSGRGAIDQAPIIDVNLYADPVPILGFHDQVRGYMMADRITETFGAREAHAIWSGVVLTNDVWPTMHTWLDDLEAARTAQRGTNADGWAGTVDESRPLQGQDSCVPATTGGNSPVPLAIPGTAGDRDMPCEQVFGVGGSPRIAAGGPLTEDVVKCTTAAPTPALYPGVSFTQAQWAELIGIFAEGVCDWTEPGVGEVERSLTWLSYGNDRSVPEAPTPIPNHVARTAVPGSASAGQDLPLPPIPSARR